MDTREIHTRQCYLGESCWLATVSLPDIRARRAGLTAKVTAPQVNDVGRINGPGLRQSLLSTGRIHDH